MAAELGLVSLTQLQQQLLLSAAHSQPDTSSTGDRSSSWMWNPNPSPKHQQPGGLLEEKDDSWEVRAFAEDTGSIMGTTWPPRSYTCTFCRREFRSAQALGGHMNVHRRDRARLHQTQYSPTGRPCSFPTTSNSTTPPPPLIISNQDFAAQRGLCLLYQLPNPNGFISTRTINNNTCLDSSSPSTLLSISAYRPNTNSSSNSPRSEAETSSDEGTKMKKSNNISKESSVEIDLELRLGQRPS
ncbi:transcriptional regulator SUPERMAN-like [Punica granatum]|nr:transcriptional regulator SUPERMAN-like [Punica granatum]PKI46888.1 hypothetical protein CRG98_032699 [Punica granatum]